MTRPTLDALTPFEPTADPAPADAPVAPPEPVADRYGRAQLPDDHEPEDGAL